MKPLIITKISKNYDNFEKQRIRKNIKGSLELNNQAYSVSFYDTAYKIIHMFGIDDYKYYRSEIKDGAHIILSLFYAESDYEGRFPARLGSEKISKNNIQYLNEVNLILVPSIECVEFLKNNGVTTKTMVFSPGVNISRFSLKNSYLKSIAYSYLQISNEFPFIISILDYKDDVAFEYLSKLGTRFPKCKFLGIYHSGKISRKTKKLIKKTPQNVLFVHTLEEDVYCSLIYNAKAFLALGINKGGAIEAYEAMASETEILALKSSVFNDIVIDNKNAHVYNDFESLINGVDLLLVNKLETYVLKEKAIASENSLKNNGKKLIKIYKEILEKENLWTI